MKTLVLIAMMAMPCFGRVWETEDQCVARYGQPIAIVQSTKCAVFKMGRFRILAYFNKGQCMSEVYQKIDGELTKEEAEAILDANGNWSVVNRDWSQVAYVNQSKSKIALFKEKEFVFISDKEFSDNLRKSERDVLGKF